jgi:hypothetical protein
MLHTNINDMTQNTEYPIHLYNGTKPIWRYPNHPEADVVAIPIDLHDFVTHRIICRTFATNNMLKEYKLDIADDIFIMGYPLGIYDEVHNLPLIRGGHYLKSLSHSMEASPIFSCRSNLARRNK